MATEEGKTYLAVPYADRDEAKALGARWDNKARAWYAPEGAKLENGLNRWSLHASSSPQSIDAAKTEFANFLRKYGLIVSDDPVMDGKYHRVPVEGDRGKERSGTYRGYIDATPAGYVENFKTGDKSKWRFDKPIEIDANARAAQAAQMAQQRAQRDREEAKRYEHASGVASAIFAASNRATSSHPYCRAKGMTNPGAEGLRTVPAHLDDEITKHGVIVASNISHSKEIRKDKPDATILIKGDLLVPAYDMDGKLWSVQSINTNFKSFMKSGRKTGLHTMAGHDGAFNTSPLAKNTDLPIVICEGRATGDSLVRALGYPVVVAFDAGNIPRVAEGLRKAYPDRPILIAGDNDHAKAHEKLPNGRERGNQGMTSAIATAAAVRGATVIPQFEPGEKGSDWNDIAKAKGLPAMRKELMAAVERAMERIRDGQHDAQERASPRERAPASRPAASRTVDPERPAARALQSSQPKQVSHER